MKPQGPSEFETLASQERAPSFLGEVVGFVKVVRKWWLLPILFVLLLLGVLIWAGGTAVAPFIYTLF
ncbi:MAG: DUF5989 family protein [Pirellulales bacterium]